MQIIRLIAISILSCITGNLSAQETAKYDISDYCKLFLYTKNSFEMLTDSLSISAVKAADSLKCRCRSKPGAEFSQAYPVSSLDLEYNDPKTNQWVTIHAPCKNAKELSFLITSINGKPGMKLFISNIKVDKGNGKAMTTHLKWVVLTP